MNSLRSVMVVAIFMALVCSAFAFPDPSGGYGIGGGLGGGFGHGGGFSTVSVVRPVVSRVVTVSRGIGHGGIGGIGGFGGGISGGYGW
ncbi:uncharacterized protein [Palaemon carinicauda]|uniref:uncharacterized protein n=1 Tax=Palaemon carinicauda TaxID=392227 RepID=UPI0035B59083